LGKGVMAEIRSFSDDDSGIPESGPGILRVANTQCALEVPKNTGIEESISPHY